MTPSVRADPVAAPEGERPRDVSRRRWPSIPTLVGGGLVALAVLLPLRGLLRAEGGSMEEGFMLVFPERVLAGDVPNKDFLHLYGPGSLWVLAAAFKAFGTSIVTERLVGLSQQALLIGAIFAMARPWGAPLATTAGLTAVLLVVTPIGLVALPWIGGLGLVVLGLVLAVRAAPGGPWAEWRPRRWSVAGGVLCGFGLLFRPDLVLAVVLGGAVLWWAGDRVRRVGFVIGLAAGSAPMLVHLAMAGVGNAVRGMVLDPVFELRPGRSLPVPPSADDLDGYLQKINELDVLDWPAPLNTPLQIRWWFFVLVAATAVVAVAGLLAVRRSPDWRGRVLLLAGAVAVGVLPQAIQRPDSTHLAWVGCFTLALLPVAVADLLASTPRRRLAVPAGIVVAALLVGALIPFFTLRKYTDLALQTFGRSRSAHELTNAGRTFYEGRVEVPDAFHAMAEDVAALAEPGDRLFVGPAELSRTAYVDSYLYHLFPSLEPATYYIEMDPGVADAEDSGLADDLASADVVILSTLWDRWEEPNESVEHGSTEPLEVLDRRFCLAGTYGEPVIFELYERC